MKTRRLSAVARLALALSVSGCKIQRDRSQAGAAPPARGSSSGTAQPVDGSPGGTATGTMVTAPETRGWEAWLNKMPPGPAGVHARGEVYVAHGGIEPRLARAAAPGSAPAILLLDLTLFEKPGMHTQALTWAEATFAETPARAAYKEIHIRHAGQVIARVKVGEVF